MRKINTQRMRKNRNWKLPIVIGRPGYIMWHGKSSETIDPFVFMQL